VTRLGARGYISCSFPCSEEDAPIALATLAKHARVTEGARYSNGAVTWRIDLTTVPMGDGRIVELVILRDLQRAVSTHTVTP
jgi:hypothetical protein